MIKTNIQWLPEIPEDWKIGKVQEAFKLSKNLITQENPTVLSLARDGIKERDISNNEGQLAASYDGYNEVLPGDLLLNPMDLVSGANCNMSTISGIISPAYLNLRARPGVFPKYFDYYFKTQYWTMAMFAHGKGVSYDHRWTINRNTILNYEIPIPSFDEQKRIADFLDDRIGKIDALIENENKQIEGLESYKRAIISSAVTKGLHSDVAMDSVESPWISQIPQGWSLRRTKYIATSIEKGSGITRDDVDTDGDIKCVRYGEIYFQYDREITKCVSSTFLAKAPSPRFISKGDVLCAGTGELVEEIGKNVVYMCDEKCLAGGDIIIVHHHEDPVYLNYALNSSFAQNQKSYGKAKLKVVHISVNEIGNVVLPLPPIETQKEIASYLDRKCEAMDTIVKDKRTKIDELKSLKSSLIYEFVTGKRRLPS